MRNAQVRCDRKMHNGEHAYHASVHRNRITKPIATLGSGSATWGLTPPGGVRPPDADPGMRP